MRFKLIENRPMKVYAQVLEVMAINHKNNASNKCLHSNTVSMRYCYVDTIVLGHILIIYSNNFKRLWSMHGHY